MGCYQCAASGKAGRYRLVPGGGYQFFIYFFPMTLLHSNVVGGRVVEPTFPMMLFHCGGRCWVDNTASRFALLRRNGAAMWFYRGIGVRYGGERVTRGCHRGADVRGRALQCNPTKGCVPLCRQIAGARCCAVISVLPWARLVIVVAASACGGALMCGLFPARASEDRATCASPLGAIWVAPTQVPDPTAAQ